MRVSWKWALRESVSDHFHHKFNLLFLLLLLLLIGPHSVFYPVCLSFCDVDVQISCLEGCLVSHFSRFSQAAYHPSCLHARLLILAHLVTS